VPPDTTLVRLSPPVFAAPAQVNVPLRR
jgi:hypothetical protein